MNNEHICYYCKHCENRGHFSPEFHCTRKNEKVESFNSCHSWEDYEEE